MKKRGSLLILIAILLLAFGLRFLNYHQIPRHGATFDEFAWTWLGINLIQKGEPISWSPHPHYQNREHLIYQGAAFWLVKPYLEHPPLFGLVAGGFALLNGAKDMYDITLARIRPLALGLGVISVLMVFLLTREVYDLKTAFLAAVLYGTVPTLVIGSRLVQNENFLIPFWLLSLYLMVRYLKSGKRWLRNTAAVIAGLLSLAKVPWLVVGLSLAMTLSFKKKWRDAILVGFSTFAFFSFFLFYGFSFDRELFLNLWRLQLARYDISFAGFFAIFTEPLLVDRPYLDGWIYFGWLSLLLLSRNFKKHFLILVPFLTYFLLYLFAIPNEPMHGWYRYPFYPFLIISSAVILKEELIKVTPITLFFLLTAGLALLANTWQELFGFSYFLYRLFIIAVFLPLALSVWKKKYAKISQMALFFWLTLFIALNVLVVFLYHA